MKPLTFVLFCAMMMQTAASQFSQTLYDTYDSYRFNDISSRRFTHDELMRHLATIKTLLGDAVTIEPLGTSAEGRSINLVTLGTGPTTVLLWSQMHGDEPTATMALFDVLNYIGTHRTSAEVKTILAGTTLRIIPMLNPDGAQRFQRRTSQGIDMNRDAVRLQTPEARILKSARDTYRPEIGFNLHDQDPRYTVGESGAISTIALLAPAFDVPKSDNAVRLRAKKITAEVANVLRRFIPNDVSRYDDTFEPRAFGDNIQKWGTSTILIESGGWKDDPDKMYIRKLNCVAMLSVFHSIATRAYEKTDVADYESLPFNTRNLYDLIIRGATLTFPDKRPPLLADIGIDFETVRDSSGALQRRGRVVDLGDLSTYHTFEMLDGSGKTLEAASVEMNDIVDIDALRRQLTR